MTIKTIMSVCSCHVTYTFQSESTLYSCLNVRELLAQGRRKIWNLSDCNWTRTQNHLVCKRTLNHLAKLSVRLQTKWFWVRVQLQGWDHVLMANIIYRNAKWKTVYPWFVLGKHWYIFYDFWSMIFANMDWFLMINTFIHDAEKWPNIFKNLAVFKPQHFQSIFCNFSTLWEKGLRN